MLVNIERKATRFFLFAALNTLPFLTSCGNSPEPVKEVTLTASTQPDTDTSTTAAPLYHRMPFEWPEPVYDTAKNYLYLTFDDGPQPGTMNCYHLIRELGVKATFFMVGMHVYNKRLRQEVDTIRENYPDVLLANHSYTHARNHYQYFYQHPQVAEADFVQAQESLQVPFKIIRLPGNSAWVRTGEIRSARTVKPVCLLLDSLGYNVIGWDLEWNFNHKNSRPVQSVGSMLKLVNEAVNREESHTHKHIVLLAHDRMFRDPADADSLRLFISELKKNPTYAFETIAHYPKLKRQ